MDLKKILQQAFQTVDTIGHGVNAVGNYLGQFVPYPSTYHPVVPKVQAAVSKPTPTEKLQPTVTPTAKPQVQGAQTFSASTPIYQNVSTESARPIIQGMLSKYSQQAGYQSPLLNHVNTIASVAGQYGINPIPLILASLAESGGLKPGARGVAANNPWSTMEPGTQNLHQYGNLDEAIQKYGVGLGGPTDQPGGGGRGRYTMFRSLTPKSTVQDYINVQNPIDNPGHELQVMIDLAHQLGY